MKTLISFVSVVLAAFIMNSCSFTTAHFKDVKMCTQLSDDACSSDNPVFATSDPVIYVSCNVANAPSDTKVNFAWYYTTGERIEIDVAAVTLEDGGNLPVYSSLSAPDEGWPPGDYEVIVSIEGFEDKAVTKTFKVE